MVYHDRQFNVVLGFAIYNCVSNIFIILYSLSREEHRRAQSFSDEKERIDNASFVDDTHDECNVTMNGGDDIDVGENPTSSMSTDDVVDVEKVETGGNAQVRIRSLIHSYR